ncbi:MAG: hypothetical protein ASARMPREDX12_008551 [Alectoria sarmentosa]|nr:MAG: hypothetical protein ASARMPREDX12_008551 [Alectoria sarmentosa]
MEEAPCIKLKVSLQTSHSAIFDLSGTNPFDVFFQIDRFRGDGGGWRSITLLLNGSLLDVPHALTNGLLEVVDLDEECKVVFKPQDDGIARPTLLMRPDDSFEFLEVEKDNCVMFRSEDNNPITFVPPVQPENRILTLPTRESGGRRKAEKTVPLRIPETIKHLLKPGNRYRLQTTSIDLGVKWWRYGELVVKDVPMEQLPPQQPATVVATQVCHRDFSVVKSLPVPPSVYISLALSHPVIYRSGDHAPILKISIMNTADHPVTMVSFGSQPHISPIHAQPNNHARVISTSAQISLQNFSITHMASGKEMVQESYMCVLQIGWQRRQFTTLEPGVPLVQEIEFLKNATAIRARMERGEYRLKLRARDVWWHWGSKEEVLMGESGTKRLPGGPKPPLKLASEDEVKFRLEEQS